MVRLAKLQWQCCSCELDGVHGRKARLEYRSTSALMERWSRRGGNDCLAQALKLGGFCCDPGVEKDTALVVHRTNLRLAGHSGCHAMCTAERPASTACKHVPARCRLRRRTKPWRAYCSRKKVSLVTGSSRTETPTCVTCTHPWQAQGRAPGTHPRRRADTALVRRAATRTSVSCTRRRSTTQGV